MNTPTLLHSRNFEVVGAPKRVNPVESGTGAQRVGVDYTPRLTIASVRLISDNSRRYRNGLMTCTPP